MLHHCGVNVTAIVCNAAADIILLSLYVNVTYVLVIKCDVAASKCHHHCGINVTVIMCSAPICVAIVVNVTTAMLKCCCYCVQCCHRHILLSLCVKCCICVSHCM